MEAPIIRVNGGSPPRDPPLNLSSPRNFIKEDPQYPDPDRFKKGIDYKDLAALLRRVGIRHADPRHKTFWPYALLQRILTRQRIFEELQDYSRKFPEEVQENYLNYYTSTILGDQSDSKRYIKIFGTLILCGKGYCIPHFIRENVCDGDIPLVEYMGNVWPQWECMLSRRTHPSGIPPALDCLVRWEAQEREVFESWQCKFNVAFLGLNPDNTIRHEEFDSQTLLPWTSYKNSIEEQGGYGTVYRAKTLSYSHGFHDVLGAIIFRDCFAVKELKDKDENRMKQNEVHFWTEVNMLKRFSGRFHDHLVTLLMTWRMDDRHYFLFPCAECDLLTYWERQHPITNFRDPLSIQWLSAQIRGMTEALHFIHNPTHLREEQQRFGRHGDLKPENILWYPSTKYKKGIFVIADFGLGSFNTEKSRSNIPGEKIPGTPGYRPPECDLKGGLVSRSYDIWTFGCLLLEMVCWALGGNQLRQDFEDARMTPYITGSSSPIFFDVKYLPPERGGGWAVRVKEVVTEWILNLHNDPRCTQYYHGLLDLIEKKMIIVLSTEPPKQKRVSSIDLFRAINQMHNRISDPRYALNPCPERRNAGKIIAFKCELNDTAKQCVKNNGGSALGVHIGEVRRSMAPQELEALGK